MHKSLLKLLDMPHTLPCLHWSGLFLRSSMRLVCRRVLNAFLSHWSRLFFRSSMRLVCRSVKHILLSLWSGLFFRSSSRLVHRRVFIYSCELICFQLHPTNQRRIFRNKLTVFKSIMCNNKVLIIDNGMHENCV